MKQKDDKDKDEEKENQDSNANNEKPEQDIVEVLKQKLKSLQQKRLLRAKENPVNEARFRAHKNGRPQSYSLSEEEKTRIFYRLQQRILYEMHPDSPMPKFLRPPKCRKRSSTMSPPQEPSLLMLFPQEPSRLLSKKRKIVIANKGIATADNHTDKKPKTEEEKDDDEDDDDEDDDDDDEDDDDEDDDDVDDDDDEFKEYGAAIYKPVESNMNELYEISKKIKDKTIQGLEGKIYALLHKGGDKVFKDYDKEPKTSFHEWVNNCDDLEKLKMLKSQAISSGYVVSRAIFDLMLLMSEHKAKEMQEKFQLFEEALGMVNRGEDTVVISRVLDTLLATQIQLKRKKDSEMMERGFRGKGVMIEVEKVPDYDHHDGLKAPFPDLIMFRLVKLIFKMELFWVQRRLPCSRRLLTETFPLLERERIGFELSLTEIDDHIENSLKEGRFGIVLGDWRETEEYFDMECKMLALWHELH